MAKINPISGFPEWLPGDRLVELAVLDRIRRTFELYGFAPLETRAVEPLDQLLSKGETAKEVSVLRRLQAVEADDDALGLHFDLTVPFARYVLENAGKLHFPFRRYQIQKVWRGERPQEGRYREFTQADIDVVDRDTLPFHYEAELPLVIGDALADLRIPRGLDYYTGTVYETQLRGYERFGSICSGGRYDNLASSGTDRFPGVGISIGVTRLLGLLLDAGALSASRSVPTAVLVALADEESRPASDRIAAALRARGIPTEVAPTPAKYGKQLRFAERRGIPYVWFPDSQEVKDIRSGLQEPADPQTWTPPDEDRYPSLVAG